jgi:adenine/guanine phosphoribosyltransferase-like PRPP-binding protein
MEKEIDLQSYVREVEDFPKEGILFYDVAPLIGNGAVFAAKSRVRPMLWNTATMA